MSAVTAVTSKKCKDTNNSFSKCDSFGRGFHFNLPDGKDTLGTPLGAAISMLMYCILIFYGIMQMHRLMQFGETVVTSSVRDSYYQMEQNFPDDIKDLYFDQFEIAFAITAYDGNPEPIDDEKFGKIYARIDQWGYEGERQTQLQTHQCSDEELGFSGDPKNSRFFPKHTYS